MRPLYPLSISLRATGLGLTNTSNLCGYIFNSVMCGQAQDLPLQGFFGIELPKYFIKLHQTAPTGPRENIELLKYLFNLHQLAMPAPQNLIGSPTAPNLPPIKFKKLRSFQTNYAVFTNLI